MRRFDIPIVRMLPFFLFIEMGIHTALSMKGVDTSHYIYLHGNSIYYATSLLLISLANHHCHCVWNRAMYLFLIVVPIFNYLDAKFAIVPTVDMYIWIFNVAFGLTAVVTAYMAIRHFIPTLKRNRQ